MGKSCSEGTLASHNPLIDTDEKLQAVMTNLGSPCASFGNNFASASVPGIYSAGAKLCYRAGLAGTDRDISKFACSAVANEMSRLCWCKPCSSDEGWNSENGGGVISGVRTSVEDRTCYAFSGGCIPHIFIINIVTHIHTGTDL